LQPGNILIISEIGRLGRNIKKILEELRYFKEKILMQCGEYIQMSGKE